jgi:hypothetical protein
VHHTCAIQAGSGAVVCWGRDDYGELRVLDGVWKENRSQLEIKAWTEVFVVRKEP